MSRIALYDLSDRPATYDVIQFLAYAKASGADHVRFVLENGFKRKNYTLDQAVERLKSIILPSVALFDLTYSIGSPEGTRYPHFVHKTVEYYNQHKTIGKIDYPIHAGNYITITLRKSRTPARDSNEEEWIKFSKRHKSVVIRDYEERPISMEDRMALYAGAQMNFSVNNGPMALCLYSDAPYLIMRFIGSKDAGSASPQFLAKIGIFEGFQLPWANWNQRLCYTDDTCENIEKEYEALMEQRKAA